jgi:multidrug efflux pump subunit AcrA (membrane-fusion protein)
VTAKTLASHPATTGRRREAQLQFLRQSAQLEENSTPYFVRRSSFLLSALVMLFIVWAYMTPVEEITQAQGDVVPSGFTQIVQHYDGGIVKEIPVHEGSFVQQGDVLLRLDGAGVQEDLNKATIAKEGLERSLKTAEELFQMQQDLKVRGVSSKMQFLKANRDYDVAQSEYNQQKQVVAGLEERVRRLVVTAPVTGLVKGIKINTVGAVVKPGEPLMEIVPTSKTLVVEAHIGASDIGNVAVGQRVKVKVSSYDYGRYGVVDGTLEFITATTFTDEKGEKYYRGRIVLDSDHVGTHTEMKILPGMTVQAGIITGRKSVMEYLLKPIQRSMKDALSER